MRLSSALSSLLSLRSGSVSRFGKSYRRICGKGVEIVYLILRWNFHDECALFCVVTDVHDEGNDDDGGSDFLSNDGGVRRR